MKAKNWKEKTRKRTQEVAKEKRGSGVIFVHGGKQIDTCSLVKKEKAAMRLDVLPYVVEGEGHPDQLSPGDVWWRLPFGIHRGIGPESITIVCPASLRRGPCPICEEYKILSQDWEENEKQCRAIKAKRWSALNVLDPDDDERIIIFVCSDFCFMDQLKEELEDEDKAADSLFFALDQEDGRTLKIKVKEDSFAKQTFLRATRIDFVKRSELPEELFDETYDLGSAIRVLSYEQIKALYHGQVDVPDDDEDEEEAPRRRKKYAGKGRGRGAGKKSSRKSAKDDDDEDEEDEDDETPDGEDFEPDDDDDDSPF